MADEEEIQDPEEPAPADGEEEIFLTTAEFHSVAQKQVMNAVFAVLADNKMDWALVAPFLDSARELVRGDFATARLRLHTVRAEGDTWVEAEEAYLGLSVSDRDDGAEWLAETWWLSEVALADGDPAEVRRIVAAISRSLDKINAWLADKPAAAAP
jgi:hypothetical protein